MASIGKQQNVGGHKMFVLRSGVTVSGAKDRYDVVGCRGHGGFGCVYTVRSHSTGLVSVLKISAEVRKNGAGGERIRREQLILRRCCRKRDGLVPALVDCGEIDGRPFFVMENLQPLSWSDNELGLPDTDDKRRLFFLLLIDSIQTVHDAGFVHCDIKPQNIMERLSDRHPLVIDFGSAHPIMTNPGCCCKMPTGWVDVTRIAGRAMSMGYDADEDAYTIQKDIFALGQVMRDSFGKNVDLAWAEIINKCISRYRFGYRCRQ